MYKILVVDDEPDVRNTLAGLLTDAEYTVQAVANESEAISALTQEVFDIAIIDVRLHGTAQGDDSGWSLAMTISKLNPQTLVIMLSGYKKSNNISRTLRYHGIIHFIEKNPNEYDHLLQIIANAKRQLDFEKTNNTIRLSLSLEVGQPVAVRTHGLYSISAHSSRVLRLSLERYARRTSFAWKNPTSLRFQVEEVGRDLWREIFAENREIESAFEGAFNFSKGKNQLFSLLIEAPRDFLRLPLEFIRLPRPSEYMIIEHPVARFINDAVPRTEAISPQLLALKEKLHVLIIASNTVPQIDGVDNETQLLCDYLGKQNFIPVDVNLIPTEQATYDRIQSELQKRSYDIVHYAGHGSYNVESPEESSLFFWSKENKEGDVVPMKATALKLLLDFSETRLVYLSCCYGTATGSENDLMDDDFLGLTDAVAQAGIPSVLGFRWPVSDLGASKMALAFYRFLIERGSPEVALWHARRELAAFDRNDPAWLSPILVHQR